MRYLSRDPAGFMERFSGGSSTWQAYEELKAGIAKATSARASYLEKWGIHEAITSVADQIEFPHPQGI